VRLHAEHDFAATPQEVAEALVDPDFAPELAGLPDVGKVEVVEAGSQGGMRFLSVRLVYEGSVEGIAAKVLGPTAPSWVQTYRFDVDAARGRLEIVPESHGSLIDCSADVVLIAEDTTTRRIVDGQLTIRLPVVGGRAERALAPAIGARIDVEADLLTGWLARD
jgi:hypothetical protein